MLVELIKYKSGYFGISLQQVFPKDCVWSKKLEGPVRITSDSIRERAGHEAIKILFTTPDLKLEGILLIDLGLDITEAQKEAEHYTGYEGSKIDFLEGYNKAKETYKFTEEDVREAMDKARYGGKIATYYTNDEIIEQLSKSEVPVSVEVETYIEYDHNDLNNLGMPYPHKRIKTQIINNEEFIILKKVNYGRV